MNHNKIITRYCSGSGGCGFRVGTKLVLLRVNFFARCAFTLLTSRIPERSHGTSVLAWGPDREEDNQERGYACLKNRESPAHPQLG